MSADTARPVPAPAPRASLPGLVNWFRRHVIAIIAWLVFLFLLAPNFVVILMSFNKPSGNYNVTWEKFSFDAWLDPFEKGKLKASLMLSLDIALLATVVATILGTLIAFAIVRHGFRGRATVNTLLFLPMAAPEIIMGTTLLTLFLNTVGSGFLGFWTILIAHIMFCLSYVVITVKSRLNGMDPMLEKAAQDLYATPFQTFRKVTLPLVAPGIAAAALLSFALSFDDFIITEMTAGNRQTFPQFIWGGIQKGLPPQVNVIGTAMMLITIAGIVVMEVSRRARERK
jgi:spermidine/putrescine transport system permease protein